MKTNRNRTYMELLLLLVSLHGSRLHCVVLGSRTVSRNWLTIRIIHLMLRSTLEEKKDGWRRGGREPLYLIRLMCWRREIVEDSIGEGRSESVHLKKERLIAVSGVFHGKRGSSAYK